jgi:pentose-5-phosphate-3-epimerase
MMKNDVCYFVKNVTMYILLMAKVKNRTYSPNQVHFVNAQSKKYNILSKPRCMSQLSHMESRVVNSTILSQKYSTMISTPASSHICL